MKIINADKLIEKLVEVRDEYQEHYARLDKDTSDQKRTASRVYGKIMEINSVLCLIDDLHVEV